MEIFKHTCQRYGEIKGILGASKVYARATLPKDFNHFGTHQCLKSERERSLERDQAV